MKTEDFDKIFDDGEESVIPYLDMTTLHRPNRESVSINFPTWMIESIDRESAKLGVARQSLIKLWLAEKLPEKQENLRKAD
ncbi:MAG: CopG family transcriptional regulator [Methylovulum sp.]|nr:CopG family transcriptional regulator [Methylovulum sp.]